MKYIIVILLLLTSTAYAAHDKVGVIGMPDGSVIIRHVSPDNDLKKELREKKDGYSFKEISLSKLPTDRTYRNAWEFDGSKIVINQAKKDAIDAEIAAKAGV